jgi:hypothetical protein
LGLVVLAAVVAAVALWPRSPLYLVENSAAPSFSRSAYELLRRSRIFSGVIAYASLSGDVMTSARGRNAAASGEMVSGNYFRALGVSMRIGAPFNDQDVERQTPAVVLSLDLWTALFHRDPGARGQVVYIDGTPYAVYGVAQEGFRGLDPRHPTGLWIPLNPNSNSLHLLVRLPRGVQPRRAAAEASRISGTNLTLEPLRR